MTDQTEIARLAETLATQSERISVLEERMNTKQAEYESALDRLRADMASRGEEASKRDKQQFLATAALIALATTVLGLMIAAF